MIFFWMVWDSVREMDKESICTENPGAGGPGCPGGAGRLVEWTGRAGKAGREGKVGRRGGGEKDGMSRMWWDERNPSP